MKLLHSLLGPYKPYKKVAIFSVLSSSFLEMVDLGVPYLFGQMINLLSKQSVDPVTQWYMGAVGGLLPQGAHGIWALVALVLGVAILRGPVGPWLGPWFYWAIAFRVRNDNSQRAIAKVLGLPLEFFDEHNPGRIASRIAKGLSNETWTYPDLTGTVIPKTLRLVSTLVILALLEPRLAGFALLSFAVTYGHYMHKLKRLVKSDQALEDHIETTDSRTSEIITNIKTIKAFATEEWELKRQLQRLKREYKVFYHRIHKGYVKLDMTRSTLTQLSVFAVFVYTLLQVIQGAMSLGHFVTIHSIVAMAFGDLVPLAICSENFARRFASISRFHSFLNLSPAPDGSAPALITTPGSALGHGTSPVTTRAPLSFQGRIDFEGVTFGYEPGKPILKEVSLTIEPNQTVALVGRSGAGKSTLVKLLLRYFEPTGGAIRLDGQDIRSLNTTQYRKRLAIVHQEVDIFNESILYNLTYGKPGASFAHVQDACRIARAEEFILQMPRGYNTMVGERGVRLSGGQRQRLGIARALLAQPDVLIFDEATSSLDYESERAIQLAMESILGTCTTLIIAHRLSTVRTADMIVVLDQGRVAEWGNHDTLMAQGGLYHRLHTLQDSQDLLA